MSYKTTNKGTELPLLSLKGKPYLQVAHRLVWFREEHPMGRISCTLLNVTETSAVARAEIYVMGQKPDGAPFEVMVSSAHKKETESHFGDFIEKAETGAIGRALAMAGFGTQFEPELDEGDRLADSPVIPARKAINGETANIKPQTATPSAPLPVGSAKGVTPNPVGRVPEKPSAAVPTGNPREMLNKKIGLTSKVLVDSKRVTQDEVIAMLAAYGVQTKEQLTDDAAQALLTQLEERLNKWILLS